jgi:pimeloyl-ACP methyl ester carboxylesterase
MNERPVQFGAGGRVFGVLTEPRDGVANGGQGPVFIILSAGMLHRVGPSRMHVPLARKLADMGFPVLRVDLAGKGDSPARTGLKNQPSVAADFADMRDGLSEIYPNAKLVLFGMCSGADNAIRLSIMEPSVIGIVLLDAVCPTDPMFKLQSMMKYVNPHRYLFKLKNILRDPGSHIKISRAENPDIDWLQFRDLPTFEQFQESFRVLQKRDGAMLAFFTKDTMDYYNKQGQLKRVLGVDNFDATATELYVPEAEHTWQFTAHRDLLIETTTEWAQRRFGDLSRVARHDTPVPESAGEAGEQEAVRSGA